MRKALVRILLLCTVAWMTPAPARAQQSARPQSSDQQAEQKDKKDKKEKDKKDKKKKNGADDVLNSEVFSPQVVQDVLGMIRDGLEGHSQRLMLSAFDGDKMDGYLTFEDQIQALFERYDELRVHYNVLQQSVDNGKGVVLVLFEMEERPKSGGASQRKGSQVRFELERGRKGWRVVDYNPRGFFS